MEDERWQTLNVTSCSSTYASWQENLGTWTGRKGSDKAGAAPPTTWRGRMISSDAGHRRLFPIPQRKGSPKAFSENGLVLCFWGSSAFGTHMNKVYISTFPPANRYELQRHPAHLMSHCFHISAVGPKHAVCLTSDSTFPPSNHYELERHPVHLMSHCFHISAVGPKHAVCLTSDSQFLLDWCRFCYFFIFVLICHSPWSLHI